MHWGFVIVGYAVVFGAIAVYAATLVIAGRSLSRKLPNERRRYLD